MLPSAVFTLKVRIVVSERTVSVTAGWRA